MDPEAWLMLYEITVRAVGRDDHVMANYVPVVLDAAANQWFLSLPDGKIDSWAEFKEVFISTYKSTCKQRCTKYDLERIKTRSGEMLCSYIHHFSET